MSHFQIAEFLAKISGVFLVGLLLNMAFRKDAAVRQWIWAICFTSPVVLLLPISKMPVPVLSGRESGLAPSTRVYELDTRFADLQTTYAESPKLNIFILLFVGVTIAGLIVLVWRLLATLRLVRAAEQVVDQELIELVYELGQQYELADVPVVKVSDAIGSPCVWGVSQPVVLVPASMNLGISEWRLILEHEFAHLRQRDPLRLVWFAAVSYAMWWNPLVWLGLRQASLAQEESIDQKLAPREGYARLLMSQAGISKQPVFSRLFGQGHLLTRVRALTAPKRSPQSRLRFLSLAIFLPLLLPVRLVAAYHPDPKQIGHDEVLYVCMDEKDRGVWRMSSDGRDPMKLPAVFKMVGVPRLSPDGKWIAYVRSPDGNEDIYIAKVDGTGERLLVSTSARDVQPVWSPDGSKLTFCTLATGNWEIGLVDLTTGGWRFLTKDGKRNLEPRWHPSGQRIIFASHRTGPQKLWSMDLDGSNLVQLTYGTWEDTHGTYSANARFVIYASNRRSKYELVRLDLSTGVSTPLLPLNQLEVGEPEWSDGDNAIVMSSQDGSMPNIAKLDLRDYSFSVISDGRPSLWPCTR